MVQSLPTSFSVQLLHQNIYYACMLYVFFFCSPHFNFIFQNRIDLNITAPFQSVVSHLKVPQCVVEAEFLMNYWYIITEAGEMAKWSTAQSHLCLKKIGTSIPPASEVEGREMHIKIIYFIKTDIWKYAYPKPIFRNGEIISVVTMNIRVCPLMCSLWIQIRSCQKDWVF